MRRRSLLLQSILPLVRYIVRNIDGKYAVHKENSGVASFCETREAALTLARKLVADMGPGIDRTEHLGLDTLAFWRETVPTPGDPSEKAD